MLGYKFRLGGLGIREAVRSSSAAFIGSVNQSKQLARVLLDNSSSIEDVDQLLFYGEEACKTTLSDLLHCAKRLLYQVLHNVYTRSIP